MSCRILHSTSFVSIYQKASNLSAKNNLLKRLLYQMRINILPTLFMVICSSVITLYFSDLIDRAKLRSTDLKPDQASHAPPIMAQTQVSAR